MEHLPVLCEGLRRARLDGPSGRQGRRRASPLVATFVLVHGGWHGGWCWTKVAKLLRSEGHDVQTPTLTGLGERAHLASPDVGLETNIADVLGLIEYEDLRDVNLVGHSATGVVISGVADRASERVGQLIYLDAVVPEDGQSAWESFGPRDREGLEELLAMSEPKWLLAVPPAFSEDDHPFGIRDATDGRWVKSKLTPQPVRPWRDALHLSRPIMSKRSYIYCRWRLNGYAETAARVRSDPGWRYCELKTGHDAMVSAPRELADALIELSVR